MTIRRATYTLCVIPNVAWLTPDPVSPSAFRLVAALDQLFDRLADSQDQTLKTLLLDGQTGLLETYLTLQPERYDQIEALLQEGTLMIGPWYVQPRTLLDIEALIRNLSIGTRTMQAFGVSTKVAYLSRVTDVPRHVAQVLRGFQMEMAILPTAETDQSGVLEYAQETSDGSRLLIVQSQAPVVTSQSNPADLVDAISAVRMSSAPKSAASCLLIPYAVLDEESEVLNRQSLDVLPAALLAVHDQQHDTVLQTTLDQYAASVLPLLPHLPGVLAKRIEVERSQLLISDIIGSNNHPDAFAATCLSLMRLLIDWIEPCTAWAETMPQGADYPILQRPQRAIEQIWRGLLRSAENGDTRLFDQLLAAGEQLVDDALALISSFVDTSLIGLSEAQSVAIIFRSEAGTVSYTAFSLYEAVSESDDAENEPPSSVTKTSTVSDQGARLVITDRHSGVLPPNGNLITTSTPNFRITAIKLPDDPSRSGIIVRGYNSGADSELVSLTPWRHWQTAEVLNLDESAIGGTLAINPEGSIRFRAVPDRLLTFWFHD